LHSKSSSLIEHLELYFGRIETGWGPGKSVDPAIQVVEFRGGKVPGVTVMSTLGLSSFAMSSTASKKKIRQELFVLVRNGQLDPQLPAALDQVARERVAVDRAVLRGEVLEKQDHIMQQRDFVAFYATLPIYYPNSFWTFHTKDEGGDVVFCWLLPIKKDEQSYVHQNGWAAFEELLDSASFDLFDLGRPSLLPS
jgi:hypothetical protein